MSQNYSAASAYNTAAQNVSSLRAVVMLYDGMLQAVYSARRAIEEGRIEDRFNATQKASKILLGLQANLDFEQGGDVAVILDRFYHTVFRDLQRINMENTLEACDVVITAVKDVRSSWAELADRHDRGELKDGTVMPQAGPPQSHKAESKPAASKSDSSDTSAPQSGLTISV